MNLSVNLNKIALLRNSRGSDNPSLEDYANQVIALGAQGITLHPRPDHRHATSQDAIAIAGICKEQSVEFNLEGNPFTDSDDSFLGFAEICAASKPDQVTLVPDTDNQLTSDSGWPAGYKAKELEAFLSSHQIKNTRTSLFIDADLGALEFAAINNFDRVEIYTGPFALACLEDDALLIESQSSKITAVIQRAAKLGIGVNAGHDLNLTNIPQLKLCGLIEEVSIGHAIISDALKYGFKDTIMQYLKITREA